MVPDPLVDRQTPTAKGRNPVFVAALIIYGTLALLWATIPGAVVSWLQGLDRNVLQHTALGVAEAVESASGRLCLSAPYLAARKAFLDQIEND
jgi:hypothetical protein